MAYPRRLSPPTPRRTRPVPVPAPVPAPSPVPVPSSEDEITTTNPNTTTNNNNIDINTDTDTENPHPPTSSSGYRLTPPRPFFFADAGGETNRSSASSDNTSLDPASDSDADPPSPSPASGLGVRQGGAQGHGQTQRQAHRHKMHAHAHPRTTKRSSMSTSTSTSNAVYTYTAIDSGSPLPSPPLDASGVALQPSPAPAPAPAPAAVAVPDSPSSQQPQQPHPQQTHPQPQTHPQQPQTQTQKPLPSRPPPSSFAFSFPFQAYPGNPDPGLGIPGLSRRRSSFDSVLPADALAGGGLGVGAGGGIGGGVNPYTAYAPYNDSALPRSGSLSDLRKPFAPFMAGAGGGGGGGSDTGSVSSANSLYRQSAAAAAVTSSSTGASQGQGQWQGTQGTQGQGTSIPRNSSVHSFRAPFLAPSSRPTSSLWSPPQYSTTPVFPASSSSPSASTTALPLGLSGAGLGAGGGAGYPPLHQTKPPLPSTRLTQPLDKSLKPWLTHPPASHRTRSTLSYVITLGFILLGAIGAGILCFTGVTSVNGAIPQENLCPVLIEDFSTSSSTGTGALDPTTWNTELELSGFGNGQFEMTTSSPSNLYIQNGELYMMPTLTSESGVQGVLDGGSFVLEGCTAGVAGVASWSGGGGGGGNGANGGMGGGGAGGAGVPSSSSASTSASASASGRGGASRSASGSAASASASAADTGTGTGTGTDTGNGNTNTANGNNNNFVIRASNSTNSNNTNTNINTPANGACSVTSNAALGTVINPVQSARINTLGKKSIKYGKVEVRAKLPRGDWLWPAIFLLPAPPSPYGLWPVSGEIDLLEARGNAPTYPAQGSNFVRSSLNFSPFPSLPSLPSSSSNTLLHTVFGWFGLKRDSFDKSFHTYTMEWTESFMRFSIDKRTQTILQTSTRSPSPLFSPPSPSSPSLSSSAHLASQKHSYFNQAKFPATARNTSGGGEGNIVAVTNPYEGIEGSTPSAPFDREFYLVVDLAVGGTSGWFPDGVGGKMWFDGSSTAMRDFARAQDTWYATWPKDASDRAFRIDYIKMWELCK